MGSRENVVALNRTSDEVKAALAAVAQADSPDAEKAEMLMEIAMGIQQKPKSPTDLEAAVALYRQAIERCPAAEPLLTARIRARLSTALTGLLAPDAAPLQEAREQMQGALATLTAQGKDEEIAEAEMNLGLICQNLAGMGLGDIREAIAAYQRSLRTFDRTRHPAEFAILQNNLATAFLTIPVGAEGGRMREALAVQSFEEGLKVVNLIDHPSEYAMLQNNLGNALQYASSSHRVANGFRALDAYDEALKVRTRRDTPGEYANTLGNKANCLANLPDDPDDPEAGNPDNSAAAIALYEEALALFESLGEKDKAGLVAEAIADIRATITTKTTLH